MNIQQLIQTISLALESTDNYERANGQAKLIQYKNSNPSQFFNNVTDILIQQSLPINTRYCAGVVISRLLDMINQNNGGYFWDQIHSNLKNQIKNKVLSLLVNKQVRIMKSAATIIAVIASIELPRGQWEDVIDSLAQHCSNTNLTIKLASITTLGYICEQIKKAGKKINNRLSQQILGSIIVSIRSPQQQIIQTSLKALDDSLSFLEDLMQDGRYRDTVFNVFIDEFKKGKYIKETYHALYQFVKVCGNFLNNYQKQLTDLAQVHLDQRDQSTLLNLQLWQTIGSQYADLLLKQRQRIGNYSNNERNFMQTVSHRMLPLIMKCLLIFNKKQEKQKQHQDMRLSAARALEAFTKVCEKSVVDKIIQSVQTIINSDDPYHQQATVILFSTICESPDRETTINLFANGFQHLFGLLNSSSTIVVKNSLIGFIRLSQSLPQVFLQHPNISDIINTIFDFVNVPNPDIRQIGILILANISEGLAIVPQPVCDDPNILLTKIVKFYADNILTIHKQQANLNQKITAIIMNIIMKTSKREIIVQLISFMIDKYQDVLKEPNIQNISYLVEQILSVLHTAILAHKNSIPDNQLLGRICDLMNSHFKRFGVQQEGLSLLGAVATTFNKSFEQRSQVYWGKIKQGMSKVNQISTFKAALSCIGDIARMMETSFFNEAQMIMNDLLLLVKQNLDRQLKIHIISCMGDLILSLHGFTEAFLEEILNITDICFQAVYELASIQKQFDYVQELKQNLVQMYSCCVFATNSTNANQKLYNHYGNLATFVVRTCDPNLHPTVEYLKSCLYLIFDSAAFYWNKEGYHTKIRQITESKQIKSLIKLVQKYSDRQQIKELLDFIHSRRQC